MRPRFTIFALWLGVGACGSEGTPPPTPAASKPAESKAAARPAAASSAGAASPHAGAPTPSHGSPAKADPPAGHEDLSALTFAKPGKAYGQVMIQVATEPQVTADLTIVRAEGVRARAGSVQYTAESTIVVGPETPKLKESNLLGSGVAMDLDGDGATTSVIKTRCDDGVVVLGTKPERRIEAVTEFTEDVVRFLYGAEAKRLVANPTAGAVLYSPCGTGKLTVGVDPKRPLTMHSVASPAVFVVYRAKLDAADAPDPFSLAKLESAGTPLEHALYSFREYEPSKTTEEVEVYAMHLVVFAIDPTAPLQRVSLAINGPTPDFITASINEVDESGARIRYADGFKPFPTG